jgi:hypothetical protein
MKNSAPRNPNPRAEQNHRDGDMEKWTRAVAVYTLLLAIFTALLAVASIISNYFIYQQYRVANDAQIDNREQLRAVISQRGGEALAIYGPDGKLEGMRFIAHFHNTGGTRTAWFQAWMSAHYFDGPRPPDNLDLSKPFYQVDLSKTIIPANEQFNLGAVGISEDDAKKTD